jgi:hypothetical protein
MDLLLILLDSSQIMGMEGPVTKQLAHMNGFGVDGPIQSDMFEGGLYCAMALTMKIIPSLGGEV